MPLDTTLISPETAGPALEHVGTILGPGPTLLVEPRSIAPWLADSAFGSISSRAITPRLDAEEEEDEGEEDPFADDDDEFGAGDEGEDDDDFLEDDDEEFDEDADFDDDDDDL